MGGRLFVQIDEEQRFCSRSSARRPAHRRPSRAASRTCSRCACAPARACACPPIRTPTRRGTRSVSVRVSLRNLGVTALFVQDLAASSSRALEDTANRRRGGQRARLPEGLRPRANASSRLRDEDARERLRPAGARGRHQPRRDPRDGSRGSRRGHGHHAGHSRADRASALSLVGHTAELDSRAMAGRVRAPGH